MVPSCAIAANFSPLFPGSGTLRLSRETASNESWWWKGLPLNVPCRMGAVHFRAAEAEEKSQASSRMRKG